MKLKIISLLLLSSFTLTGCQILQAPDTTMKNYTQPITLNVWGVYDSSDDLAPLIKAYKSSYPYVTVQYTRFRYDEYKQALLEAFATDRGPDIFAIQNTWVTEYQKKGLVSPLPSKITMAHQIVSGTFNKQVTQQLEPKVSLTIPELKKKFIDVVYHDVVIKKTDPATKISTENIYGLPMSADTLALFYNKDLFNNAGITNPPQYWDNDFQQMVKKLTKQDNKAQIIQSGAALGGGDNIERATDILSVLMMQSGADMMDDNGNVKFSYVPENLKREVAPGAEALRFYTDFASPAKEVYCWNSQLPNSIDLFTQGKLAMLFGYSYMLPTIAANGPKVNFAISSLPQIKDNSTVNFANYWVYAVSTKILSNPDNLIKGKFYAQQKQDTAWDFIQYITAEQQVKDYLNSTGRPTALRSLIDGQKSKEKLGIFADQLLTAKSWYKGSGPITAETFMKEMINNVVTSKMTLEEAISKAAQKISQIEKQNNTY
jgi:ABC-type glycerol-3-phosphate transport system substrate-binding protein